ncbi:MMPL family transporter [Streptomyces sp. NBC_01808]|uniref:MMPL family transporter n=1 Tax=Streptomyces sp. NBC_01808 TaxID=2975947 RepID=UPI002DDC3445|nr:MMPL family transporter [Streptomyces sp. NBC_01808]WSA42009.1 MMPL family transporter [Streptomyces sp. NBC_01808]
MLTRIAELVLRRTRLVLALAVVAVVAMAALGFGAFGKLSAGGFSDPGSPSSKAQEVIDDRFGGDTNLVLLVSAESGGLGGDAARERGLEVTEGLRAESTVTSVMSYWDRGGEGLTSQDGSQALVLAHVAGGDEKEADHAKTLTDEYAGTSDGVTVRAGGGAAVSNDVSMQVAADLALAEAIAVPLTLVLLVLAFGSVIAALLPLAIGLVAIFGTFAELWVLGSLTDVSVFSVNLTIALGLGLGIDYGLLLVSRFREQLAAGDEVPAAIRRTVATAGRTIAFSSATIVAALAALLVFPQYFLRSFAYAGIGVVAISAISALVIIPALLAVLGHRVNRGRIPGARAMRRTDAPLWGRIAGAVMRRPALTALPVLGVLLLAASPLLGVSYGTPDERVLPESAQGRQVATALREDFAVDDSTAIDVVTTGAVAGPDLTAYATELSRLDGVARVAASNGTYADGAAGPAGPAAEALGRPEAQRLTVSVEPAPKSGAAQHLVEEVRAVPAPGGVETLVGGTDAELVDAKDSIGSRLPLAVGMVLITTFVLLFLFTGSVVQPLRAVVLNAVSLAAAMGVMVWIFQDGHLSGMLGFTPQPMDTAMTVLMFCIAFGLSMDYEVFLTSRIKELHDAGADPATAVTSGLARTGRIVTMAAGLLAVSFFAFGTGEVSFIQMFGLGSGLAILIDAIAVRGVLVPAAMRLLGRHAWYAPRWLRRVHGRVGLSEAGPGPAAPERESERAPAGV